MGLRVEGLPRIAFVTLNSLGIDRGGGSGCASAAILEGISAVTTVDLFHLNAGQPAGIEDALRLRFPFVRDVHVIHSVPRQRHLTRLAFALRGLPVTLARLENSGALAALRSLHTSSEVDCVHYDFMSWLFLHSRLLGPTKPVICTGHDAFSLAYRRKAVLQSSSLLAARDRLAARAFGRFERRYLSLADAMHFVGAGDIAYLVSRGVRGRYVQINMPIEARWFEKNAQRGFSGRTRRFLLSGPFDHPWYSRGAQSFLEVVWPGVVARHPAARCEVHCPGIGRALRARFEGIPGITLTGWVDDYREVFRRNDFFVHPLLTGTGQKNRLAVALAQGLCCFATPAAAADMGMDAGHDFVLLDRLDLRAAGTISDVVGNANTAGTLAECGRRRVLSNFAASSVAAQFLELYRSTLSRRSEAQLDRSSLRAAAAVRHESSLKGQGESGA